MDVLGCKDIVFTCKPVSVGDGHAKGDGKFLFRVRSDR